MAVGDLVLVAWPCLAVAGVTVLAWVTLRAVAGFFAACWEMDCRRWEAEEDLTRGSIRAATRDQAATCGNRVTAGETALQQEGGDEHE